MRKHLLGLMLIAGLAACTSDTDPNPAASGPVADPAGSPLLDTAAVPAIALRAPGSSSFASLPDRGELLAYGGARKSRQSGAYHYHPVALSEEHALNAIASGEMVLATPDGETLRLGYENHEEHPDGNWTWIGRNADGSSAVLTFGEKAVFGLVTRGDEQFRVRTDRTGAWVVATDRSRLAPGGARRDKPDFLLPPEDGALAAAGIGHMQKAAPRAAERNVGKATAVVDVLLGYSSGLVQQLGSQSVAQTRMLNMVSAANTAYANSGVNMRLRAVHALQVNYADTSDNEEALQQLTGYNATTRQPITPNTAFNALRAARDEYGADLVAFVRAYREPEQNGCGIAWLLGMNGSGIQAARDAEFGYAVISDGEDRDERDGFSYFCSDFSLAHEFGHLMGQAHNSDDAAGRAGVHAYSYGYRETSASGFFTIMAYPLGETQLEIPHFANPQVRYQNRVTGTATADNARSMNLTMPIVSAFRDTVVELPASEIPFDFNGDGRSEIVWWRNSPNQFSYTLINGNIPASSRTFNYSANWGVDAIGDFDGDGRADVISVNSATREYQLGRSTGTNFSWTSLGRHSPGWEIIGAGDVNNDGRDDILWWNASTRQFSYSLMLGTRVGSSKTFAPYSPGHRVGTSGDFNGDGLLDLISVNPTTREYFYGRGTGDNFVWTRLGTYSAGWQVIGAGDINGDGRDDILWWHASNRQFSYSLMNGAQVLGSRTFAPYSAGYGVNGVGDFNGDGRLDLISASSTTREYFVGINTGNSTSANFTWTRLGQYSAGWQVLLF